jgi:hypothetical protein
MFKDRLRRNTVIRCCQLHIDVPERREFQNLYTRLAEVGRQLGIKKTRPFGGPASNAQPQPIERQVAKLLNEPRSESLTRTIACWAMLAGGTLPVVPQQSRDPRELGDVVRDHREAASQRVGGNLEVVRSDALPRPLQCMTNASVMACSLIVEGHRIHWGAPIYDVARTSRAVPSECVGGVPAIMAPERPCEARVALRRTFSASSPKSRPSRRTRRLVIGAPCSAETRPIRVGGRAGAWSSSPEDSSLFARSTG